MAHILKSKESLIPLGLGIAAVLFYTPFLLRGFICDDILWIANARIAMDNPSHYLSRAMYGYFRPLNMVAVSVLYKLFGLNPFLFSFFAKLVHGINVMLLFVVCRRLNLSVVLASMASIFFAFYVVNSSAIFYISTLHDLMMVTSLLIFTLLLLKFLETSHIAYGIALVAVGLAATLLKEAGFMSIALYFVIPPLITGRFPRSRNYYVVGALLTIFFASYLIYYFATRVHADRELSYSLNILKNLWYAIVFAFMPTTERIIPPSNAPLIQALKIAKVVFTIGLIPVFLYVFRRGESGVRVMIAWIFLLLLPTSLFNWKFHLFSLYPESTMTRFMYVAIPGIAVFVAWIIERILPARKSWPVWSAVVGIGLLFLVINFVGCKKVFGYYHFKSNLVNTLVSQLETVSDDYSDISKITIFTSDMQRTEQEISTSQITSSLYWLYYNKRISFETIEDSLENAHFSHPGHLYLRWDPDNQKLIFPEDRHL